MVRSFLPTSIAGGTLSSADTVTSYCWSADGSRLAVACASGHVYVLDRSGLPLALLPPSAGPWASKALGALALPSPSVLLLLTVRPPLLFTVPLGAPPRALLALRPQQLGQQHDAVRVAAYDARTSTLVIAGEGSGGGKGSAPARVSVSAWRVELVGAVAAAPTGAAAAKVVRLGCFVGSICDSSGAGGVCSTSAAAAPGGAAWSRRRWTLSMSPLGEHVAVVAPPSPGVLLLSLPQCQRVDPSERFGGRTASPVSAFRATLARSAESAASASWWSSETALALSDLAGDVGLAQLPGYDNLLAGDEQPKYAPGALVASKPGGPGARGLLVLEPLARESGSGSTALTSLSGATRGGRPPRGAAGAESPAAAAAAAAAPGFRLLLLAERTPEQMLQVHMRNQQWGRALELCAAAGLDADRVYCARWASRLVDAANIADNLAKVADRRWVVAECCRRVAADYEGQRKLINYGLRESARQAKPPAAAVDDADDASSSASAPAAASAAAGAGCAGATDPRDAAWWSCTRLRLWRHSDRLEVLYAAQGRSFNPAAYAAFRDLPLTAAAGSWAATGAVGPLAVMAQHYPASLSGPVLLGVLSRLPETINPRLYSALLPRAADGDEASTPPRQPPVRKTDWVEQPEVLAEIGRVIASGSGSPAAELPDLDPEATDALVRVLAPRPRLSAGSLSEWYADRALQLDAETGQLQGALTLLELGWERGARGPRVAQLLGAARALAGVVGAACQRRASAATTGGGPALGPLWRLRLGPFAAMPGEQQLRLLLAGSGEDSLAEDLRDRVVPFLRGPGCDLDSVGPLVGALLAEEMAARPCWAAALVEAEARGRMLFESAQELAQAVTTAVVGCPHTDEWPSLERAVAAVEATMSHDTAEVEPVAEGAAVEGSAAAAPESAAREVEGLLELRGFVRAGSLLAARGLPLTVRHISSCGREEAARCVRQVLGRVQRSCPSMADSAWADLWRDLAAVRSSAFPFLPPEELLGEVARCMLHCGRNDLANAYLHGGAPGATPVALDPEAADALIVSAAAEILAGANDPWDSAAQQSAACLALASPDAPPAVALRRLVSALQLLPDLGLELIPAQVMQMQDRFEVIRLILEDLTDGAGGALTAASLTTAAGGVGAIGMGTTFGLAASAALGGRSSRRRAAVRAAGRAAAAGGRAAASFAGGLLAVAGRVAGANVAEAVAGRMAPVADMVAGAVAATVSAAAAAAPTAMAAGAGGAAQPPYKQVGRLLELAELLGLDAPADELRLKELAGRAALRAGDLAATQHLALELVAARYVPGWSLCADLGCAKQLQDDVVRQRLLSYALLHCPAERMTRLLEELRGAERRCCGEAGADGPDPLVESPEYLLRVALLAGGQRAAAASPGAPPTASLPSPGDTELALAVLAPGGGGGAEGAAAAAKLIEGLRGDADGGGSAAGGLPYAQLQRVVALECYCLCLGALLPAVGGGAERLRLMEQPLGELLRQVRQLGPESLGSPVAAQAAAAAIAAADRLAAARDSRAVRQHVPDVDAAQFASGGGEYRRRAILQQSALAGAAEAEAPGASPRAAELLEQARRLAGAYGVDPWDVDLHFTCALITAGATVTPELRAAVQSREPALLQRPSALLRHLAAVAYPALPPASGPHLALWLAVLTDCLHACAKDDPTASALSVSAAPLLSKLRDLLEKAAAALKGLALTQVHAPLLAPLLAPLGVVLVAPPAAADTASGGVSAAAAAAAIFAYVKPSNLAQAAKLVTALHKLLGPQAKKIAAAGALLFPGLQGALDELPPSLPYMCLCVKAVGTKSAAGGHPQQQQQQQSGQRDMAVAWAHVEEHVARLPPVQLAAWLAFLLLPGSACPLDTRVTGSPLYPCPCPVDVRLTILDACMAQMLPSGAAAAAAAEGGAEAPGATPELLRRLQSLHRRLLMLRMARQHAAEGLSEKQLQDLELSLLPPIGEPAAAAPGSDSDTAGGAVCNALSTLAAAGCPSAVLLEIAGVAVEPPAGVSSGGGSGPSPAAAALLETAVGDAVETALSALLAEAGGNGDTEPVGSSGLTRLRGLLNCLDRQPRPASAAAEVAVPGGAGGEVQPPAPALGPLRDLVWRELQRFTDERLPALERLRPVVASELLDMQAGLGTRAMWADWATAGGSFDDAGQLRLRLLATRTRALLAHLLMPSSLQHSATATANSAATAPSPTTVQVEDLATREAAERLFTRLLEAARASGGGEGRHGGSASLAQLRLLARLLADVWRDGEVWTGQAAAGGDGADGTAEGDAAPAEGIRAVVAAGVSPLHRCWRHLAEELLCGGHLTELVGLLDPPASPSSHQAADRQLASESGTAADTAVPATGPTAARLPPLSFEDVRHLIQSASGGAAGPSAGWCLGLASLYRNHQTRALEELEAASQAVAAVPTDVAVLLLALLIRSGDATRLTASCHPLMPCLVASAPASPADAVAVPPHAAAALPLRDGRAAGCVLQCLAAELVGRRHCGLAAALVSRRLRLHPACAAAGGSMVLLKRYLLASAQTGGAGGEGAGGADDAEVGGGELLGGWPGAVQQLWSSRRERCRRALRVLNAAATEEEAS